MNNARIISIGNLASFSRGLTYSGSDEVDYSYNVVLRSNNIDLGTNTINFDELKYISDAINIPEDKKLQRNSIFMCMSNGSKQHLGKVAFIDRNYPYAFGGFMGLIKPNEDIIMPKLLYYYFCSSKFKVFLSSIGNGANINNIKFVDIAKDYISVPEKTTQQSIIEELDKINELIRLKKEQLGDYDKLAQSLFYEMFGDPVENEKGWDVKKFSEVASFKNGLNFGKNENGYSYKILGVGDFKDNFVVNSSSLEYINLNAELSSDYFLNPEDIVFVRSNGSKELVGRCVSVDCTETTTYSGFCIRCRLNENSGVLPMYLLYVCKNKGIREYLTQSGRGCNISNVNQKILNSTNIIIPPLSNQQLFIRLVELIEQQKAEIKRAIADLETLLASRMQYWFD